MNNAQNPVTGLTDISETAKVETSIIRASEEKKFYPTGAIAFFIALVILCLAIWFGIYFLMLDRV
ncbi:MAG TPA: cytochrome c oxidase subunit 2A [Flavitalea sp.]|nr:cytochrome c oxidase subunit 2A [Flavitalea sp.]